jgi:hypothetical protein
MNNPPVVYTVGDKMRANQNLELNANNKTFFVLSLVDKVKPDFF